MQTQVNDWIPSVDELRALWWETKTHDEGFEAIRALVTSRAPKVGERWPNMDAHTVSGEYIRRADDLREAANKCQSLRGGSELIHPVAEYDRLRAASLPPMEPGRPSPVTPARESVDVERLLDTIRAHDRTQTYEYGEKLRTGEKPGPGQRFKTPRELIDDYRRTIPPRDSSPAASGEETAVRTGTPTTDEALRGTQKWTQAELDALTERIDNLKLNLVRMIKAHEARLDALEGSRVARDSSAAESGRAQTVAEVAIAEAAYREGLIDARNKCLELGKEHSEHPEWARTCADGISELLAAPPTPAAPEAKSGWWCPKCNRSPRPIEVTFEEHHEDCGTYIGNAAPPSAPISTDEGETFVDFMRRTLHEIETRKLDPCSFEDYLWVICRTAERYYKTRRAPAPEAPALDPDSPGGVYPMTTCAACDERIAWNEATWMITVHAGCEGRLRAAIDAPEAERETQPMDAVRECERMLRKWLRSKRPAPEKTT